ncbi:hypothetical protein SAMN05216188_107171 [Lentzea xinjiangensis]|uniref:Uncharacterized protein n=1 Tax=Lentzea xinjiangensis TaxID=402600 RepID=A0A1H9KZ99_9PSEU|nr:hypothetical protein SAMN05216188_107171 [Lentzea xinjiangensis]
MISWPSRVRTLTAFWISWPFSVPTFDEPVTPPASLAQEASTALRVISPPSSVAPSTRAVATVRPVAGSRGQSACRALTEPLPPPSVPWAVTHSSWVPALSGGVVTVWSTVAGPSCDRPGVIGMSAPLFTFSVSWVSLEAMTPGTTSGSCATSCTSVQVPPVAWAILRSEPWVPGLSQAARSVLPDRSEETARAGADTAGHRSAPGQDPVGPMPVRPSWTPRLGKNRVP